MDVVFWKEESYFNIWFGSIFKRGRREEGRGAKSLLPQIGVLWREGEEILKVNIILTKLPCQNPKLSFFNMKFIFIFFSLTTFFFYHQYKYFICLTSFFCQHQIFFCLTTNKNLCITSFF